MISRERSPGLRVIAKELSQERIPSQEINLACRPQESLPPKVVAGAVAGGATRARLSGRALARLWRRNSRKTRNIQIRSFHNMPSDSRLPLTSNSPNAERLSALKTLYPEAFTEDKVDFERLKQALGDDVQTDRERYGLSWAGKSDAIHVLQSLSVGTLQPMREDSVEFDATENLIIEGDNLEVLKLLQKSYFGKVKMIYIDPPYNTGNEFIYPDNFREGLEDYLKFSGQLSAEGTATSSNRETDGRYHSKWLSMMYPRLFLAKNLLREDGVIFISIDDNEVHNLRLLMNEIFGEENYLQAIIWKRHGGGSNDSKYFAVEHEYILAYAKNKDSMANKLRVPLNESDRLAYQGRDEHYKVLGPYKTKSLVASRPDSPRPNLRYKITAPDNTEISSEWRWEKERFDDAYKNNKAIIRKDRADNWQVEYKIYLNGDDDERTKVPRSLLTELERNSEGRGQLREALGDDGVFNNPKPTGLVKYFSELSTHENDIILDFFAGSGTTAQAVLELNKADGGNRKFILVQLPEKTENAEFPTIAHITRERVRRVIAKMNAADSAKLDLTTGDKQDRGFKAFRLAASNFKIWQGAEGAGDDDALSAQLDLFAENLLPEASPESVLFEILLKSGYDLNAPREEILVAGQAVSSIAGGQLLICLERNISRETLQGMIRLDPAGVVCLDEAFHGDDALLTNFVLQMQDADIIFNTI